jgi:phosphoribulokinase
MPDYIETIVPQFHRTHINFHRVPLIDTSDPFSTMSPDAPMGPAPEDSLIICHVRHQEVNLEEVKAKIPGAFLQNAETLVCNGKYMVDAMDLMMTPIIQNLIAKKRAAMAAK